MAAEPLCAEGSAVTSTTPAAVPAPRLPADVVDLAERRGRSQRALAKMVAAPIKHVPLELLEALQGSWGTPEELGLVAPPERHLRVVAG